MKRLLILILLFIIGVYFSFYLNTDNKTKNISIESKSVINEKNNISNLILEKNFSKTLKVKTKENNLTFKPNLKLKVPEKWQHLDYSILGNPAEVSEDPKNYLAGDEIYGELIPDNPKTYRDGKTYLDAKAEKKLLEIFTNRERLKKLMLNTEKAKMIFNTEFSDINNFVKIDEEMGRKMLIPDPSSNKDFGIKFTTSLGKMIGCFEGIDIMYPNEFLYGCENWEEYAEFYIIKNKITSNIEKEKIIELYKERHKFFDIDYLLDFKEYAYKHINKSVKKKEFDYFIKNYEKNPDEYEPYYDQLEVDYYYK